MPTTTLTPAKTTAGFPKLPDKFIPNLQGKADDEVVREVRRVWNSIFNLRDAASDIVDQTITKDVLLDRDLVAGKQVLFIVRQDSVGGHAIQFQTLKDATLKFKGQSLVVPVTTANTYVAYLFYATTDSEALLIGFANGGNLV